MLGNRVSEQGKRTLIGQIMTVKSITIFATRVSNSLLKATTLRCAALHCHHNLACTIDLAGHHDSDSDCACDTNSEHVRAMASLNLSFNISGVWSWFHPGFSAPTRDDSVVETWYLRKGRLRRKI